jgi:hypothetical protein
MFFFTLLMILKRIHLILSKEIKGYGKDGGANNEAVKTNNQS